MAGPARISTPHEPAVSIVVPVYNEEESLPVLVAEIRAALADGPDYELLLVDDGSTDGSPAALARLAAAEPRIRVLRLARNGGQSAALAAGFRHARAPVTVTLDADLQNDPADIPRLLAALAAGGSDVVCGVRAERQDDWVRRVSSRIANGVRNRLTHERVTDVGCTLRACRTEYLRRVPVFAGMHRFLPTLLRMEGARIEEVPVRHRPRRYGRAKYGIGNRLWRGLADLLAVRWMQSRWIDRGNVEEITAWDRNTPPSGSSSASSGRPSSSAASSSSGSPPSAAGRASFPTPSGT
ncbi:MAG TPA: glycosyltransferase family 2 protein [Thermoanaerobaculia bacterium]|nr:glycosyltransferase family 2 protein [Thermoanaerobaculia bacterium]